MIQPPAVARIVWTLDFCSFNSCFTVSIFGTLSETNIAPENRPKPKKGKSFPFASIFCRSKLAGKVSGEGITQAVHWHCGTGPSNRTPVLRPPWHRLWSGLLHQGKEVSLPGWPRQDQDLPITHGQRVVKQCHLCFRRASTWSSRWYRQPDVENWHVHHHNLCFSWTTNYSTQELGSEYKNCRTSFLASMETRPYDPGPAARRLLPAWSQHGRMACNLAVGLQTRNAFFNCSRIREWLHSRFPTHWSSTHWNSLWFRCNRLVVSLHSGYATENPMTYMASTRAQLLCEYYSRAPWGSEATKVGWRWWSPSCWINCVV